MGESVGIGVRIAAAVMAWPGVERAPHRFGGIEFRLGKRELGLRGFIMTVQFMLPPGGTRG
jgi:hypothetical protein